MPSAVAATPPGASNCPGPEPDSPEGQRQLAEARRELENAEELLYELIGGYQRDRVRLEVPRHILVIHADPALPENPVVPDTNREVPAIGLRASWRR